MIWWITKLLFNSFLFVVCGWAGLQALIHGTNGTWLDGFVFCSTGEWLFHEAAEQYKEIG